jgi:hypothetical protein
MTVTPELEARPSTEIPAPGPRDRLPSASAASPRRVRSVLPWVRLALLLVVACLTQLIYVFIWPLSYFMTQATDFTVEYLTQYPEVWQRLQILLARFDRWWPGQSASLGFLVDALMQAFIGAFILYIVAILLVRGGLPPVFGIVAVIGSALAFQATLFFMPGLYTTDIFSYVMYSHIAGPIGANPYIALPSWYPEVHIFQWIHPLWQSAPSIYGPAWIDLTMPLARAVVRATDVDKVLAYKALVNVGHMCSVGVLAYVVHKLRPGHELEAVVMYAWNPLIVFEFGGNGHNDAVMVAVMLLGLALYASEVRWLGIVTMAVSMLLKMTSLFILPFYAMAWARDQKTWARFFGVGILATLTVPVVIVAFYWPWWNGLSTISPIINWSQGPMYNNYVPDILAYDLARRDLANMATPLDPMAVLEGWRSTIKSVARVFLILWFLVELWRVRGALGIAGAGARVMLVFLVAVNTWVLPWYFSWPLALAVVLGWESTTAKVLLGFSLSAVTVMYYHHFWHPYMSDTTYLLYLAPILIAPVDWVVSFVSHRWRAWRRSPASPTGAGRDPVFVADARR